MLLEWLNLACVHVCLPTRMWKSRDATDGACLVRDCLPGSKVLLEAVESEGQDLCPGLPPDPHCTPSCGQRVNPWSFLSAKLGQVKWAKAQPQTLALDPVNLVTLSQAG